MGRFGASGRFCQVLQGTRVLPDPAHVLWSPNLTNPARTCPPETPLLTVKSRAAARSPVPYTCSEAVATVEAVKKSYNTCMLMGEVRKRAAASSVELLAVLSQAPCAA